MEKDVIKILLDGINSKANCKAIKIHNAGFIEAGTPDIIASINGNMLLIEAKRDPSKKPSAIQQRRLDEWEGSNAMVSVIKGVEQAKMFVRSLHSVKCSPINTLMES